MSSPERYITISRQAEGLYKDKGSRFLAFAEPVSTAEEAKTKIESYRRKYHDARHVCFAYVVGAERTDFRSSDDGEPSGTAGKPILGQLNARSLTNTLVVVVRYFGGILLGTGGLVVAYRSAAADALDNAGIEERDVTIRKTLVFPYEQTNSVMRILKDTGAVILSQDWQDNKCVIECEIKKEYEHRLQ